jgi:hypothetical protein
VTKAEQDQAVQQVAAAFRLAAVTGNLPAHQGPLPFLTLARLAVTVMDAAGWRPPGGTE